MCVVALFAVYFTHKAPAPEKALTRTPKEANVAVGDIFIQHKKPTTTSALALIADNDLFAPSRGASATKKNPVIKAKKSQFELIGLCNMGSLKGAMIINTSSRKTSNKKQFYLIDEPIAGTGYKLIDIDPKEETATIGAGNTQYSIKLERDDAGSLRRRTKGESDSKTMISLSRPKVSKTSQGKPPRNVKAAPGQGIPVAKTKPRSGRKTPAQMKKLRQDILRKMMSRNKK